MHKTYIGQCIYCRALPTPEDPLQGEHIMLSSIFGRDLLVKAGYKVCADKTSVFDTKGVEQRPAPPIASQLRAAATSLRERACPRPAGTAARLALPSALPAGSGVPWRTTKKG